MSFFKNLWDYVRSVYFWRTVLYLGIFIISVILLSSLYLKVYTRHNQSILTPAFEGRTLGEAQKIAKQKGLHLVVIDSIYEGVGKPGTIVDQTPPTNFKVKKGRTIFVTIKAYSPKMIAVPDVTQISLTQAEYDLKRLGLDVGKKIIKPSANFDNLVLAMMYNGDTLQPGVKLPQGTKIDLIVAKRYVDTLLQAEPLDSTEQGDDFQYQQEF